MKQAVNIDAVCAVCRGSRFQFMFETEDRFYHIPGRFGIHRCLDCGLMFVHPFLDDAALAKYYPSDYYSYEAAETSAAPPESKWRRYAKNPFRALNALVYSKVLRQNSDPAVPPGGTVLDVGCGDGGYLSQKKAQGCRVYGVEISASALKRLSERDPGISAFCGALWDAGFEDDYFDLVVLSHVVEHVRDLNRLLAEIRRILKPGGQVLLQVPNSASVTFGLFGRRWVHLDSPRHVYVFSKNNLTQLLKAAGFVIRSRRTLENSFSVLASAVYVWNEMTGRRHALARLRRFWDNEALKTLLAPYALAVNLAGAGDTMEFILTKDRSEDR